MDGIEIPQRSGIVHAIICGAAQDQLCGTLQQLDWLGFPMLAP
jgi:cell shape-determining protein MreD